MLETWRWFDLNDPISLRKVAQTGAKGIVSSLNEIPTGDIWPMANLLSRKLAIEGAGLTWSVVESIPVHNDIKTRTGNFLQLIENYKQSIINVGKAGIGTVCYNFMPVVDWTRTNLDYLLENTGSALRFDMVDFVAYDIFILKRPDAKVSYNADLIEEARNYFEQMSTAQIALLEKNIIAGLPGGEGSYNRESIKTAIAEFIELGEEGLRQNLIAFLAEIVPVAETSGVNLCVHPDDPPFSLFGLPRVVSTQEDVRKILSAVDSPANGLTLCAGSFGARADNNLVDMVSEFGHKIHFVHLRNVVREPNGSFYEAEHLDGDNDMVGLIDALLTEENRRKIAGDRDALIPMRPDHGHLLEDEASQPDVKPGYSYLGRLKGLAELRGVIHAISQFKK
ncbi:mannonate dehydratase [Shewanella sp. UCD-KL21]|uniref:mannonate dehydratase n=1 Tax=Shewanella sp. UCD-KL21 TaxID=1917164 RepID=UPI0009712E6C|nr:mannonate dehydratase [Shewanella sp. UCD-KL21]